MSKKIAIVCGSPSSEFLAPFDDDEWDVWVLGSRVGNYSGKKVDKIFEIHNDLDTAYGDGAKMARQLRALGIPLVVGTNFPLEDDHIEVFPFEAVEELFGSRYLTSSTAYMMSYAIMQNPTHIGVYGVDMAVDNFEYFQQRPCMEAWIGFAKGKGIDVYIPETSSVGKSMFIYGAGESNRPSLTKAPFVEKEFSGLARDHENCAKKCRDDIHNLTLKLNAHERMAKIARAIEAGNYITSLEDTAVIK